MKLNMNQIGKDFKRTRNEKEFNILYKELRGPLFDYMIRRFKLSSYEADEYYSEVMLKVWDSISMYNEEYAFSSWIYTMTKNIVLLRKFYQEKNHHSKFEYISWSQFNIQSIHNEYDENLCFFESDHQVKDNKITNTYKECIKIIKETQKDNYDILEDAMLIGMKYKDVAKKHNTNISSVKNKVFKAKKILRNKISKPSLTLV